jgi:hypothetical protein
MVVCTCEWLTEQVGILCGEIDIARQRKEEAKIKMVYATDEYNIANETVENLEGCLRGIKDELYFLQKKNKEGSHDK